MGGPTWWEILREFFCWHQWKGVEWGWNANGNDHSGEYYCIHCGKWLWDPK